jgi:hypothetical protein
MKKICFFNHKHNGDIFHSKSFVNEIVNSIDAEFSYAHSNHPNLLKDLKIEYEIIPDISNSVRFLEDEDTLYVNTWIGSYFVEGEKYYGECTLRFSYEMFSKIYDELNKRFNTNLKLSSIENYIPTIDYSKFDILNIENYIKTDTNKKILFCNGPCLSGQCRYYGDMNPIINSLAKKYQDITFIVTHKIDTDLKNIKFTNDIIKVSECDLNEIGYLSTFCDIIIGRNSGPFCFSTNTQNINNSNTIFYAFGEDITTCFLYEIDLSCSFIFEYFSTLENIESSIDKLILEL